MITILRLLKKEKVVSILADITYLDIENL